MGFCQLAPSCEALLNSLRSTEAFVWQQRPKCRTAKCSLLRGDSDVGILYRPPNPPSTNRLICRRGGSFVPVIPFTHNAITEGPALHRGDAWFCFDLPETAFTRCFRQIKAKPSIAA